MNVIHTFHPCEENQSQRRLFRVRHEQHAHSFAYGFDESRKLGFFFLEFEFSQLTVEITVSAEIDESFYHTIVMESVRQLDCGLMILIFFYFWVAPT